MVVVVVSLLLYYFSIYYSIYFCKVISVSFGMFDKVCMLYKVCKFSKVDC